MSGRQGVTRAVRHERPRASSGLSTDTPHRWSPWAPDQDSRLAYSTKVACNSLRKPYKGSIYNKRVRPPAPFPLAAHTTQVSPRSPPRGRGRRRDPPSEPPLSPLAVSPRELSLRCSPPHRHTSIHTPSMWSSLCQELKALYGFEYPVFCAARWATPRAKHNHKSMGV